ncbi:MAG: PEP-CTERM sorting domain-containing protein [Candidatus Solibacter usitatus]|nr:PEP-CTERM sorting domain-containing protein [Candidatus Solibacter usitatus]
MRKPRVATLSLLWAVSATAQIIHGNGPRQASSNTSSSTSTTTTSNATSPKNLNGGGGGETLHIGTGAGTGAPGDVGAGIDPNPIQGTRLSVFQNQGGNGDLNSPLLLILGIPNFSGVAPAMASVTQYTNYTSGQAATGGVAVNSFSTGGANIYGGTWNANTGFAGSMTSASPDVYTFLSLTGTSNSNSFGNWAGAVAAALNFTPASFGIYVYRINAALTSKGLFDVMWQGSGPGQGSIAVAYGRNAGGASYGTPFTQAGMVIPPPPPPPPPHIPEPATAILLGTVLLAGSVFARRLGLTR